MLRAAISWIIPLAGLTVVGPLASAPLGALRTPTAMPGATPLVSTDPLAGVVAILAVLAAAGLLGIIASMLVDRRAAMNSMGSVLIWGAWRTGPLRDTFQSELASDILPRLAIEGAIVGVGVWLLVIVFARVERQGHVSGNPEPRPGLLAGVRASALSAPGLACVATTIVAGALVAWIVMDEPLKNQAIFAALLAGIAAGAFGRLAGMGAGDDPPFASFMLGIAGLAALGPMVVVLLGGAGLDEAARLGRVAGVSGLMAFDWVAGAAFGVPIGSAWVSASTPEASKAASQQGKTPKRVATSG